MELIVPKHKFFPRVSVPARKTALIIGDMVVDFVDPKGKLFVADAPKTVPAIRLLLDQARQAGVRVIFIQDWHSPDDPEFAIWGPHAVEGTPGTEIIPELAPRPDEIRVRKRTYDPFFGTDLELLLNQRGIQNLVITGTVSNICVLHTASSASLRGFRIVIPVDGISALNPFDQELTLRQISFVYQGKLTLSDGITFRG